MLRVTKRCAAFLFGAAAILLFLAGGISYASPSCSLNLPPGAATMIVDVNEYKACNMLSSFQSPLLAALYGLPSSGYDITNGMYNGFCADLYGTILDNPMYGGAVYTVMFYSSTDPLLPNELKLAGTDLISWNKINYVLKRYPAASWLDVQAAVWSLVHGCELGSQTPGSPLFYCHPDRPLPYPFPYGPNNQGCPGTVNIGNVKAIVDDANTNGGSFTPGPGDPVAVVVDITSCTGSSYCNDPAYLPFQVVFIPQTCCSGSIGDFVWHDLNRNGIQDAGEPGIGNVTVNLLDGNGNPIKSTFTDGGGFYQFTGLCAGTYFVEVDESTLPSGYTPTTCNPDASPPNIPADSNCSPARVTLSDNESNQTIDFGYVTPCTGAIGNYVWIDANKDGQQDQGESPLGNVRVNLTGPNGYSNSMQTTADGFYQFMGLCPGTYTVSVVTPAGYKPTPTCFDTQNVDLDANCSPQTVVSNNDTNNTIDFGFYLACDLVLEKTCEVPSPPPGPFVCSSAKPIDAITMIWNGTETISIKAWKGAIGSTLLTTINDITPGKEVTVSGYAGSPYDVIWELFNWDSINKTLGNKIGNSTFHLSCSDVDMNGPEDCAKPEGDGKDKAGYINNWIFEGMAGNGQVLDCTPVPNGPTNECVTQLGPVPDCTTAGKPTSLTFRYTGGGCAESKNTQAPDKAVCTATPTGGIVDGLITVRAAGNSSLTSDVYGVSPTTVDKGFEFTITFGGNAFKADSYVEIKDTHGVKELNRIHTSCSQPLKVGDVFGSLELVAFNDQTAGNEVSYTYALTNNGDALANVTLSDDKLGNDIIDPPTTLASDETKTYKVIVELTGSVTNTATATGYLLGNQICSATASATVTVQVPQSPFVCSEAKPLNSISMVWNGTQNIKIKAWKGAVGSTPLATIDNIKPGDEVTVTGYAGSPNDVYWEIFNAGTTEKIGTSTFHLSCSDADMNGPEDCGKFEGDGKGKTGFINDWLFAGMAGNGRTLDCGVVAPPPPPAIDVVAVGDVRLGDHWLWWDLKNSGPDTAVITKVEVTAWPSQQGKLKKIKLDGDVAADPADIATPPAIITAFTSDVNKKKIAAGQTRTFTIEFEKNYLMDVNTNYSFKITFEGGETLSWNMP